MSGYGSRGHAGRGDGRRPGSPRGERRSGHEGRGYHGHRKDHSGTFRPSVSSLTPLPSTVPVPKPGRALPASKIKMEGSAGRPTKVLVNHFELQSLPLVKIYFYNLQFNVPGSSQKRGNSKPSSAQLIALMQLEQVRDFVQENFVFDGVGLGWSTKAIVAVDEVGKRTFDLPGSTPERLNQIEIALRNNGTLDIKGLVEYLFAGRIELDLSQDKVIEPLLRWLNAVYRQDPASRWTTRPNSSAFFERASGTYMPLRSTSNILEAIRGIFQSVQIRFGRLTLNVDTATTAFWAPQKNLVELVHALAGVETNRNLQDWFLENPQRFFDRCDRLIGLFFNVRHLSERRNARKIGLRKWTQGSANQMAFDFQNQGQTQRISVANYFQLKYNITLRYPRIPMADTKDGWIPLELCWSASGERFKEPLQGAETADFIKFATAPASVRQQQIMESVKKLQWHALEAPRSMGLSAKTQMLQVPARILPSPAAQYGSGTDQRGSEMGSWNLRGKRFFQPAKIQSWGLMYFPAGPGVSLDALQDFSKAVQRALSALGISMPNSSPVIHKANQQSDMTGSIADLMGKTQNKFGTRPDLLMFLLHGSSERLYRGIKSLCDVQFGVASQVMVVDKALSPRGQPQYLANIGMKVNVKRGGINAFVADPLFRQSRWMLMGADTSHPSPAQLRMDPPPPTYAAVTASYDQNCCSYTAVGTAQFSKEQLISDFEHLAKELLNRYSAKNRGGYPQRILFYRDGLGESQFNAIMAEEVQGLKDACDSLEGPRPKITVVVCVKRHHTRMFPTEKGDRLGNVLPGTVIENSNARDIFLVAHAGLQGTVRPTQYAMLMDENNLSADDFQRLTNNICSSYARATRAVSLVPAVYYADQACERARLHLREGPAGKRVLGQVNESLKFCMYWQ